LLEVVAAPGTFLVEGSEGLRGNRELKERLQKRLSGVDAGGLPDSDHPAQDHNTGGKSEFTQDTSGVLPVPPKGGLS
jgi:hypothetical protein